MTASQARNAPVCSLRLIAARLVAARIVAARLVAVGGLLFLGFAWPAAGTANAQSSVRLPAGAVTNATPGTTSTSRPPAAAKLPGADPTAGKGAIYDSQMWKIIAGGSTGTVSIPDKNAGILVQTDGWRWMQTRNGPLPKYSAWAMGAILALLALFLLLRGRIKIESGWAGRTITRFSDIERMGHWLLAMSFIILAVTGLNVLYGKSVLLPIIGKGAFAGLTQWGKLLHNYVAFAFMAGLAMTFIMWVWKNLPDRYDIGWLLKGGGWLTKGTHPPARKFNAGQKILFWIIMWGGLSICLTGLSLMFPFQVPMFAKTFAFLNVFGLGLATSVTPIQEMQYASTWHSIVAIGLTCVIFAHIYIGTIGMQGGFSAMGSGEVDLNWAKEHHSVWADEVIGGETAQGKGAARSPDVQQPAE